MSVNSEMLLNKFCVGEDVSFYRVQSLMKQYNIDYILVTNVKSKQRLLQAGYDMVLSNKGFDKNPYYLFRVKNYE